MYKFDPVGRAIYSIQMFTEEERGSFKCRARASALPNVLAPNFVVKTDVQALVAFDRIPQIPPP